MKHLVLGSSGQIGYHLCEHILNKTNDTLSTFDIIDNRYEDLRINNNLILEKYIEESDFIYFLAFDVGGSRYLSRYQDTYNFINNNTKLISNTFELLNKYNKPFLFASSQMSNMSHSTYGVLKSIGESYTKSIGGIITHFWNVYGIEKDFNKSHVITDFVIKAIKHKHIDMLTDGEESRQFLYGDDCSEALYILSQKFKDLDKTQPYHVTSFQWTKIIEIAKIIQSELDCSITPGLRQDDLQLNKMNSPNELMLDHWKPKTTIQSGIKKIINYYANSN